MGKSIEDKLASCGSIEEMEKQLDEIRKNSKPLGLSFNGSERPACYTESPKTQLMQDMRNGTGMFQE